MTPYAYSAEQATQFLKDNGGTTVKGAPISVPGNFGLYRVVSLSDYVSQRYPPWGVVVHPNTSDVMVWYDANGKLHVIDVTGHPIADQIPKAAFESPDSSLIDSLLDQLNKMTENLPSAREAMYGALAIGAIVLVVMYGGKRRR